MVTGRWASAKKEVYNIVLVAAVDDGRRVSKLEKLLSRYGDIEADVNMRASVGKGRRPIAAIVYLVTTDDPATLRNALANNKLPGIRLHVV